MIRRNALLYLALVLILSLSAAVAAQEGIEPYPFEFRTDPVLLVASYYNAIGVNDYERAYGYWESAPDDATLAEFSAGFADTAHIAAFMAAPVAVGAGAGNAYAEVPVLLVAEHIDGTQHVYSGCVTTHKVNVPVGDATEPDPNWSLRDASIAETDTFDLALLQSACENGGAELPDPYTDQDSPVNVLASYFDAITHRDYARAFGYWQTPPAETLEGFAAGFAETARAAVIVGMDGANEGAAGSLYVTLPTLITAETIDGETQYFAGCYVLRHSNVPVGDATEPAPEWWIFRANVRVREAIDEGLSLLSGACASDASG